MSNFTFLENDQIFSENRLDMFKKYGTKCAITDFSILLGGYVSSTCYTNEGNNLKDRTGAWWTKTPDSGYARAVDNGGFRILEPCKTMLIYVLLELAQLYLTL